MVDCQIRPADVTKFPIIEAMLTIPREEFVPDSSRNTAYVGDHVELSEGRILLDPRVFAKMLDGLDIRPDEFVLDVGCGLGYSSAVIAQMAEAVVALEEDDQLADSAAENLSTHAIDNAVAVRGALKQGASQHGPYDTIVIQGGVQVLPTVISDQLKDGGKIACIFSGRPPGECCIGIKNGGRIVWRSAFNADAPLLTGFEKGEDFAF